MPPRDELSRMPKARLLRILATGPQSAKPLHPTAQLRNTLLAHIQDAFRASDDIATAMLDAIDAERQEHQAGSAGEKITAQAEPDRDLVALRSYLSITDLTADRCGYVNASAMGVFRGRAQIASISRTDATKAGYRWCISLVSRGVLTEQRHFETMLGCLAWMVKNTKGAASRQSVA